MSPKLFSICDMNPGAMAFMTQSAMKLPVDVIKKLETGYIKGTDLYILLNDLCDNDFEKVIKLVRECPDDVLQDACHRQDRSGKEMVEQYLN